ncbi:MAG TPA: peptidoglycan DD-metalloendopeptidase family protein [Acidimicrobiia bacterium]|nr:peptidoglycan DD-metalloendopeptidase family protein [Acidimicrobiia bacterium]
MSRSAVPLRRALAAVVVFAVAVLTCTPALPARAAEVPNPTQWVRPVDGSITRAFVAPVAFFGAGHRGIDVAVEPGTALRAPAAGVVAFAGTVARTRHVVVLHDSGLRTSFSFLATVAVRRGTRVARGQVVGTAAADGPGHRGVVHVGLRDATGRYLDPSPLFGPVDLTEVVRLVPTYDRPPAPASPGAERRNLLDGLADVGGSLVGGAGSALVDGVGGLVGGATHVAGGALGVGANAVGRATALSPVGVAGQLVLDLARGALAWRRERDRCDPDAPGADGSGGSAHRALFVSGINSSHDGTAPVDPDWPVAELGYDAADVRQFSYAPSGGLYARRDTFVGIEVAAARLARDLRAMQREHPGREVDLLAHSQGGVVVLAFLALQYDAADPAYPPLGTVVTLASPHRGAPGATAARFVATTPAGRAFLSALERFGVPPVGGSVDDLAEGSDLVERLDAARLPEQIDLTTIGAAGDYVVPASHATRDDATAVVVNPWSPTAHSAIVRDPDALRAVRAALERRPMPCLSFLTHLVGAAAPTVITRVERTAGTIAGLASVVLP